MMVIYLLQRYSLKFTYLNLYSYIFSIKWIISLQGFSFVFRLFFYVDIVEIAMFSILLPHVGVAYVVGSDDKVSL